MILTLSVVQAQERLTVTLACAGAASPPSATIIIDGKAYAGLLIPIVSVYDSTHPVSTYDIALERGSHVVCGQATDSAGTVLTAPLIYVMTYELTDYGIDVYSGDAKLDAIEPIIHDELLPVLPTLNFSCATLLTGTIGAVIRERGLRRYQFEIATVAISGPLYVYTCLAAESYALTTAIMVLQTAYGAISDTIKLLVPSLNIINVDVPTHSTVNLVANGEFEANTAGWVGIGATLSRETVAPLAGTGSLKILLTSNGGDGRQWIGLTVGHQYIVTCRAKSTAAAGRLAYLYELAGWTSGTAVDCSTEATLTFVFTAVAVALNLAATLAGGLTGESLVIDSVTCYDLTLVSNVNLLAQPTYPQMFNKIQPLDVIEQLLIQALAQASVRDGILHAFPLDVRGQTPDYHMQRLDPLTGWQRDSDVYDAVEAHYIVKQYPTPDTYLTLHDAANWIGVVTDVTQVAMTLLLPPSGALGMLKSAGNCSRAGLNAAFKNFDRIRFNWNPPDVGSTITVSLLQDTLNKLELTHTFAGQSSSGFILNTGTASADTLVKDITLSPIRQVKTVAGTTTAFCSYRVSLFGGAGELLWQDGWSNTFGNTFVANVPPAVSQEYQITTVRIEFKDLYLVDGVHYGVQVVTCDITVQSYIAVGTHVSVVSSVTYSVLMHDIGNYFFMGAQGLPATTSSQWYEVGFLGGGPCDSLTLDSEHVHASYQGTGSDIHGYYSISVAVTLRETVTDYAWVPSLFAWSSVFNLFEAVDISLASMTRTGNPMNLATIVLTFSGDNYVDTLVMVVDNPSPVTVRAGTGSRAYPVTDDFGSEAGAQAYANGLLPVVSVAREQYTRDVPLSTDLSVGDTISGDGVPMTVYAVDYRADGKTIAAGRAMDILKTQLAEYARRIGTLERKA